MQVRPSRAAAGALISNNIPTLHVHPGLRVEPREVPIPGAYAEAMVYHHQSAIACASIDYGDYPIGGRANLVTIMRSNVHARVERAFPAERIQPLSEMSGDFTLYRPERGHHSQTAQLRRRQQSHAVTRHGHRRRVLLQVAEFIHRFFELSLGLVVRSLGESKRSLPEACDSVGHCHFAGQRLQRVQPLVGILYLRL